MSELCAEAACFHCGLPVEQSSRKQASIQGVARSFCCSGCALVCETIHNSGLSGFYQKLKSNDALAPPPETAHDFEQYDLDDVQSEFVTTQNNQSEAVLLVEGIHCAACVWLIEHALKDQKGVLASDVNMAHHRLRIRWQRNDVLLSSILRRLSQIGYNAVPYNTEAAEGVIVKQQKSLLYRMAFAGFGVMNVMWLSIALYSASLSASGIDPDHKHFFHMISLLIATPVLAYSGWPIIRSGIRGLLHRQLTMDLPVTIGALATYFYSVWITFQGSGEVYFDTVVTFLFIILVGRYLETLSRRNATSATGRLMELQPRSALRYDNGQTQLVSVRSLRLGDYVLVRPGDKIPVDGVIIEGYSEISEALLTGESQPVIKDVGDKVIAGTVNGQGALVVKVENLGKDTALAKIVHLVEAAQGSRAPIQCLADRIVPWFVATTIGLAIITFFFWVRQDFDIALLAAVSVLIITCPCAFGLATPMGIAVSVGHASRYGLLIKNGEAVESLAKASHVVFDKTGTITEGKLSVADMHIAPECELPAKRLLALVAAAESRSEHHIAKAVVKYAKEQGCDVQACSIEAFNSVPGYGLEAMVDGITIAVGNDSLLRKLEITPSSYLTKVLSAAQLKGHVAVYIIINHVVVAVLEIQDSIRPEAYELINVLKQRGIGITLLTGDSRVAAEYVADKLGGIAVIAEVLPQHKDQAIAELQSRGERVVMVGDGINDAPALARADVGFAMGGGTDVSMDCADLVLMDNSLNGVLFGIDLAQNTLKVIRQNISLSLGYNILLVPMAMAAMLTPVFAAVAMPISSLAVIGNALRIRRLKRSEQ